MAQVRHPAFPDTRKEVDNPGEWVKQGWLLVDDDAAKPKARRSTARRTRASTQTTTSKGEQDHG